MLADAATTVASGSLPLALGLALLAGVVSFASPCVLPLVPGFLAYVTGLTDERRRTRLVTGALLFVLGFTAVFLAIAVATSSAAQFLRGHHTLLMRVGGVVVILLGLVYLGLIGQQGRSLQWRPAAGLVGAPLLGAVFALGMSPCVGPVLGAILSLSAALPGQEHDTLQRGVLLATVYSIGMGLPFVLIAAGWSKAEQASRWLRSHHRVFQVVGGALMIATGVLMVSGVWEQLMSWVQTQVVGFETVI